MRVGAIVMIGILMSEAGCISKPTIPAGVTRSRMHALELAATAALVNKRPLEEIATIEQFQEVMERESEGLLEHCHTDEWGRPFLVAAFSSGNMRGILFVSIGPDEANEHDDLRLWILSPDMQQDRVLVSRSWDAAINDKSWDSENGKGTKNGKQ